MAQTATVMKKKNILDGQNTQKKTNKAYRQLEDMELQSFLAYNKSPDNQFIMYNDPQQSNFVSNIGQNIEQSRTAISNDLNAILELLDTSDWDTIKTNKLLSLFNGVIENMKTILAKDSSLYSKMKYNVTTLVDKIQTMKQYFRNKQLVESKLTELRNVIKPYENSDKRMQSYEDHMMYGNQQFQENAQKQLNDVVKYMRINNGDDENSNRAPYRNISVLPREPQQQIADIPAEETEAAIDNAINAQRQPRESVGDNGMDLIRDVLDKDVILTVPLLQTVYNLIAWHKNKTKDVYKPSPNKLEMFKRLRHSIQMKMKSHTPMFDFNDPNISKVASIVISSLDDMIKHGYVKHATRLKAKDVSVLPKDANEMEEEMKIEDTRYGNSRNIETFHEDNQRLDDGEEMEDDKQHIETINRDDDTTFRSDDVDGETLKQYVRDGYRIIRDDDTITRESRSVIPNSQRNHQETQSNYTSNDIATIPHQYNNNSSSAAQSTGPGFHPQEWLTTQEEREQINDLFNKTLTKINNIKHNTKKKGYDKGVIDAIKDFMMANTHKTPAYRTQLMKLDETLGNIAFNTNQENEGYNLTNEITDLIRTLPKPDDKPSEEYLKLHSHKGNGIKKGGDLLDQSQASREFNRVMSIYGDMDVIGVIVVRQRVPSYINALYTKILPYDTLYHLSLHIKIRKPDGNIKYLKLEKQSFVSLSESISAPKDAEFLELQPPFDKTLRESFEMMKVLYTRRLWSYDAFQNNCQVFVCMYLSTLNKLTEPVRQWILQDKIQNHYVHPAIQQFTRSITQLHGVVKANIFGGSKVARGPPRRNVTFNGYHIEDGDVNPGTLKKNKETRKIENFETDAAMEGMMAYAKNSHKKTKILDKFKY